MKRLSHVSRILALGLLVGVAASPAAADILIDDFTVGVTLILGSGTTTGSAAVAAPVPGGFTEFSATKGNPDGSLVITTVPGVYSYSSGGVPNGGTATITWDGVNNNALDTTGLNGFDLTGGGANNAFAGVIGGDGSPGSMTISVWTGGVQSTSAVIAIPDSFLTPLPFSVAFSSFPGSPNFADVGAIQVRFVGTPNTDFQFDAFRVTGSTTAAVPEASSLSLLGFGALALFLRRRRQS